MELLFLKDCHCSLAILIGQSVVRDKTYFVFFHVTSERRREKEAQKEASMEEMKVSAFRTS